MSESQNLKLGEYFRFITPMLICLVGYFGNMSINDIRCRLEKMDSHFTNHLEHHQDLEVGYEKRLSTIESKQRMVIKRVFNQNE